MATTRVEMQPLLENESELRRQQESTNSNRGAGSGGARMDIAPPYSRCNRIFSGITLVFILFVYFWLIFFQLLMAVQKKETWKICALSLSLALQVSVLKSSYLAREAEALKVLFFIISPMFKFLLIFTKLRLKLSSLFFLVFF